LAVILKQYGIVFLLQRAIKGQALANFLADHLIPDDWELNDDLPGEEVFYIDILPLGKCVSMAQLGEMALLQEWFSFPPKKHFLPYSFMLTQLCSNTVVEYQALSLGLQMAIEMGIIDLNIYGDTLLVINQLHDEYEVRKEDLVLYHKQALRLLNKLGIVKLEHVPRNANKMAASLASLTATLALGTEEGMMIPVCSCWRPMMKT